MSHTARQALYVHQRGVLKSLAEAMLRSHPPDTVFAEDSSSLTPARQKRVIVDRSLLDRPISYGAL